MFPPKEALNLHKPMFSQSWKSNKTTNKTIYFGGFIKTPNPLMEDQGILIVLVNKITNSNYVYPALDTPKKNL